MQYRVQETRHPIYNPRPLCNARKTSQKESEILPPYCTGHVYAKEREEGGDTVENKGTEIAGEPIATNQLGSQAGRQVDGAKAGWWSMKEEGMNVTRVLSFPFPLLSVLSLCRKGERLVCMWIGRGKTQAAQWFERRRQHAEKAKKGRETERRDAKMQRQTPSDTCTPVQNTRPNKTGQKETV
jgi:hypothetical protein